jgi:hypothetical protein
VTVGRGAWILLVSLGLALAPACGSSFSAAGPDAGGPAADGSATTDTGMAEASTVDADAGAPDASDATPPTGIACGPSSCPVSDSLCCVQAPPPPDAGGGTTTPFQFTCSTSTCPGCDTELTCSNDADCDGKLATPLCCIQEAATAACTSASGRFVSNCRTTCTDAARMCDPKSTACSLTGKTCKVDPTTLAQYGLPGNAEYGICE